MRLPGLSLWNRISGYLVKQRPVTRPLEVKQPWYRARLGCGFLRMISHAASSRTTRAARASASPADKGLGLLMNKSPGPGAGRNLREEEGRMLL